MTIVGSDPAYLDALFNVARFGASRFGAFSGDAFISIDGGFVGGARPDAWTPGILNHSLTIQDLLDDRANTMAFTAWNFKPRTGAEVVVTLGSKNNATRLFAGYVIDVNQVYVSKPVNRMFHASCIDYTWRLMDQKAWAKYTNESASAIVTDLLARFAPAVSPRFVQQGLPVLDELTITNEDLPSVFKRIANRIGGYFYVDESAPSGALHFFTVESRQPPRALTPTHPSLSNIEREEDLSQIVTRALSEGGGGNTAAAIAVGASTIPVDVGTWYAAGGGFVNIGPNRVKYTDIVGQSGAGSLVGTGVSPSAAPTATAAAGAGIEPGVHEYAYTWTTAAGETRPSPSGSVALGPVPTPTVAPYLENYGVSVNPSAPWAWRPGDAVDVAYTYAPTNPTSAATSGMLGPSTRIFAIPNPSFPTEAVGISGILTESADPIAKHIYIWHRVNGGTWYLNQTAIPNYGPPTPAAHSFILAAGVFIGQVPPAVAFTVARASVAAIAVGPATVTARKLYRTAAGGGALKLLATIADNVTTTYADATADAALGAVPPVVDTSGLKGAEGQANPGATVLLVAGTGWATPGGGWAVVGNGEQVIRYTGITATTLTGIPASGPGAITSAVPYNSSITGAPTLVGIPAAGDPNAVRWSIKSGDPVNVLAIVDDLSAQAAVRAMRPGHSGVVEEFISDGRLSLVEATARASALLASKSVPQVTLRYNSRDVTTRSGTTVTADLPAPTDIHDTLKIQQVTIDGFNLSPVTGLPPTFHATASSDRFTLEDLLRQARP